jgi:hypothetical protein
MSFLGGHISDISDAIHDTTGRPTGLEASPLWKRCAVRSAEEREGDLDEEDLITLVDIFTADVSAVDTYIELRRDGLRKAWVANCLKAVICHRHPLHA